VDGVIRITLAAFIVILCGSLAGIAYSGYVESAYEKSLEGTYGYTLSFSTDSTLSNATFFIPVPEDPKGNSPVIGDFSAGNVSGLPDGWKAVLYDTGKSTLVKITARPVPGPAGAAPQPPAVVTLLVNYSSGHRIETADPVGNGTMFRPADGLNEVPCPAGGAKTAGSPECFDFQIPVYADYTAPPGASLTISSSLSGRNDWKIFGPEYNQYTAGFSITFTGGNHGWATAAGTLRDRDGYYDEPKRPA